MQNKLYNLASAVTRISLSAIEANVRLVTWSAHFVEIFSVFMTRPAKALKALGLKAKHEKKDN
jgi:hypothetical protein